MPNEDHPKSKEVGIAGLPKSWAVAVQLDSVQFFEELGIPPGINLEALSGDRIGENSIRINDQYRHCFKWTTNAPYQLEIADYH